MRLIDADALAKFIDYGHLINPNEKAFSENDIREMIDMMPTIKETPSIDIVRCGECMWYHDREGCFFSTAEIDSAGFCSFGERR